VDKLIIKDTFLGKIELMYSLRKKKKGLKVLVNKKFLVRYQQKLEF